MNVCRICLRPTTDGTAHHAGCLESLYGVSTPPRLDFSLPALLRSATDMAGKMSISGVQEKVSLKLSSDRSRLELAPTGGTHILKPEPPRYLHVPQNEHATMRMAEAVGVDVPAFGLCELADGATAYVVKRFDRLDDGSKLAVEDLCQLAELSPQQKYSGSGELCVRVLRKYASEPLIEVRRLFKLLLFSWCVSNGDQHLKNFSMFTGVAGQRRLTPAYDLLCTRLPIPSDRQMALTIGGKRSNLTRKLWMEFARYCRLPDAAASRLIDEQADALETLVGVVHRSFLPNDQKAEYETILREQTAVMLR